MPYSQKVYETANRRFEARKMKNKQIADQRREEIFQKIPEYSELETELAGTMTTSIQAIADRNPDSKEIIRRAMEHNLEIQADMERLLEAHGYPRDYMSKIYYCDKCRDSGFVEEGRCDCYSQLLKVAAAEEFNENSTLKLCRFEDFDLSLYPDNDTTMLGVSSRTAMAKNLELCVEFAKNFPGNGKGLLITGLTGLGKTHLSLSIANEVIQRGYSVIYNSAPEVLTTLEKESFGRSNTDIMPMITSCDLLILDDLGTEYKSDRIPTFLYEILNTRLNRSLPTIVNTNLDVEELNRRYSDRICSRLLSMRILMFVGKDNRFAAKNLSK